MVQRDLSVTSKVGSRPAKLIWKALLSCGFSNWNQMPAAIGWLEQPARSRSEIGMANFISRGLPPEHVRAKLLARHIELRFPVLRVLRGNRALARLDQ